MAKRAHTQTHRHTSACVNFGAEEGGAAWPPG